MSDLPAGVVDGAGVVVVGVVVVVVVVLVVVVGSNQGLLISNYFIYSYGNSASTQIVTNLQELSR